MESHVWLVRTYLDNVLVYNRPPSGPINKGTWCAWGRGGRVHVFSQRDNHQTHFLDYLMVDAPWIFTLSTETQGRWSFRYGRNLKDQPIVSMRTGEVWTMDFCPDFLTACGVEELSVGGVLHLRVGE